MSCFDKKLKILSRLVLLHCLQIFAVKCSLRFSTVWLLYNCLLKMDSFYEATNQESSLKSTPKNSEGGKISDRKSRKWQKNGLSVRKEDWIWGGARNNTTEMISDLFETLSKENRHQITFELILVPWKCQTL